ncbi:thiamine biosynthesis protein-like protein (Thi-4) [Eremomyces bilateralis CBS 781.70]|uniref:Thiamine biosynthesis protein-like protein (Thi-4) n=1 Tax=Eremomyces bilateralis CBS 781.70 TaxID=1392243 RepID=A0A6G1G4Y6_9PEZI|nr:thiamine biosynthesis protein-like protein (Thi-4) [Eremomyces bilateralis CBS 781.70]KAF1812986.1 thiamine biosynthesis protein-like protein (Thi-4) [Eremomyces bilateralis CBS 781.70]
MNRRILVIAGSDSSGGAGLEADQKTIAAHGCYAMTATTALTAQNTMGVRAIHETPPDFLRQQIAACVEDIGVDIVKTGMVASEAAINVICDALQSLPTVSAVIDPVMVATTGSKLLPESAVKILVSRMLPLATILTPNVPEAQALLAVAGKQAPGIENIDSLVELARLVQGLGPKYVLLKGGHAPLTEGLVTARTDSEREIVTDILVGGDEPLIIRSLYSTSNNTHGTGCSLASAIASNLALGKGVPEAVKAACRFVEVGIKTSQNIGKGSGPINHFHSTYSLPFAPGYFIDYILERADVREPWAQHVQHDFVMQLARGSLDKARFNHYLVQDYLFLIQFARANALAAYKAKTLADIQQAVNAVADIQRETALHITFCEEYGLSKSDIERAEESQACTAYTRYVLDVGHSEDWLALQIALLPCLLGYGVIATRLIAHPDTVQEANQYYQWIEQYAGPDYQDAVRQGRALIEEHATKLSPSRVEELVAIFIHATKMEIGFWEMGSGGI